MKKLMTVVLAVVFVLALGTVSVFADATNIALGKSVETWDQGGANDNFSMPEWFDKDNLTDGRNEVFDGNTNNLAQSLAWYTCCSVRDTDITATVDLEDVYKIGDVYLYPTKFLDGNPTPETFVVDVSTDEENWTVIGGETGLPYAPYSDPFIYDGQGVEAQYIRIRITKESQVFDNTNYYGGFGELEVYEYVEAQSGGDVTETQLVSSSFDTLYIDDVMNFGEGDGLADSKLDNHNRIVDGSDGSVSSIKIRGWIGFNKAIDSFGYKIGDADPVYGSFATPTEDAVKGAGGEFASRFEITVPVADLTGRNPVAAVVKLDDGDVIVLDGEFSAATQNAANFSLIYDGGEAEGGEGGGEVPATSDASIVLFMVAAAAIALVALKKKAF